MPSDDIIFFDKDDLSVRHVGDFNPPETVQQEPARDLDPFFLPSSDDGGIFTRPDPFNPPEPETDEEHPLGRVPGFDPDDDPEPPSPVEDFGF